MDLFFLLSIYWAHKLLEIDLVMPPSMFHLLISSSSVSSVFSHIFPLYLKTFFVATTRRAHHFSLLQLPCDNVCHLIMTVRLFGRSFQLFLLVVDLFLFSFFWFVFVLLCPDCMLVSQATFQSKHFSFFCSLNISVPTFPPVLHLLSCELLCGNVQTHMLHPESSLVLCTLQTPSTSTIIVDGHFLKLTTLCNLNDSLSFSSPVLSFIF